MDPLAIMTIVANRAVAGEAWSALPDAPVVEVDERERVSVRTRAAAAAALRRLADAVAPPTTACAGGQ